MGLQHRSSSASVSQLDILIEEISAELGEDWYPQQPEPQSDCPSELDHYAALHYLGQCPSCGLEAVVA